jgi:hypothetical protein
MALTDPPGSCWHLANNPHGVIPTVITKPGHDLPLHNQTNEEQELGVLGSSLASATNTLSDLRQVT